MPRLLHSNLNKYPIGGGYFDHSMEGYYLLFFVLLIIQGFFPIIEVCYPIRLFCSMREVLFHSMRGLCYPIP